MLTQTIRFFAIVLFLAPLTVFAQQTSTIVGVVSDTSGAVVPDANVTIVNSDTEFRRTVSSNSSGQYTAASIPAGTYQVTVEKAGFERLDRRNITLNSATNLRVDLTLTIGSTSETVTVTGSASYYRRRAVSSLRSLTASRS